MRCYESRTKIYIENTLDYVDHTLIDPKRFQYDTLGMWNQFTHNGMLYLHLPERERRKGLISGIRNLADGKNTVTGVTTTEEGIVVQTLGNRGDIIYDLYSEIAEIMIHS